MDYKKHYHNLTKRSQGRLFEGYTERHHIVPRCMGGTDDPANLVDLTAEEHYVAHQLLFKIYPNDYKLAYAAQLMTVGNSQHQRTNNKLYGWIRRKVSKIPVSKETRQRMSMAQKGRTAWNKGLTGVQEISEDTRKKLSEAGRGRIVSNETRKKISDAHKGRAITNEHRRKISKTLKGNIPWNKGKGGVQL